MTIYAFANDMTDVAFNGDVFGPVWTLISPAAVLQGGNPYFVPDFAARFEARLALAVKIGKLGKGIAPRFASRYVEAAAPAVVFAAADRLELLREKGLPWTSAISYDRSLALGRFTAMEFEDLTACECGLLIEGGDASSFHSAIPCSNGLTPGETIHALSRDNTLKTGDLLLMGLSDSGPEVWPGAKATLTINGREALRFNIR